jgi:NAD(P)-dependent dehydrogenase (short-subunit alcohol dehydrogenase family)
MPVAMITGASRGFGRALATDLARDGWKLVVDGRDHQVLEATAADLIAEVPGATVRAVAGDVADARHRTALVSAAAELGGLDLLVNNASRLGPSPQPRLADYPLDALEAVYRVNVIAPLGLVQEALPLLAASNGMIVAVTSDAAVEGYEGWGGYGSSKAALEQLSHVLAAELPDLRV